MATHNFFSSSSSSQSSSTFTFNHIPISSNSSAKAYDQGKASSSSKIIDDNKQLASGFHGYGDDVDLFCVKYGLYQENDQLLGVERQFITSNSSNNIQESTKLQAAEKAWPPLSPATLRILGNRPNSLAAAASSGDGGRDHHQKLSAMQIVRLAGERFVQFSDHKFININIFKHPYSSTLSELCSQDKQDVELVQLLLAAAEKVSDHQFDRAIRLVSQCRNSASCTGTPVQRAAFYFADALQARIERQTGKPPPSSSSNDDDYGNGVKDGKCLASRYDMAYLIWHQTLPFSQVVQLSATQTILDHVVTKPKVHLVDFYLRTGVQWSTLMQALSERAAAADSGQRYFRFTAIETTEKEKVEETGKRLESFATQFNLPFSINVLYIPDLKHFTAEQVEIKADEAVVIHASFILRTMISKPVELESVMRAITRLKPSVMVVQEVEANLNSPSFVHRFIDALFYYSAYFDALEDTMRRDDQHRASIESGSVLDGIRNIVAAEGRERVTRSVSMQVWREFFGRFGVEETELSQTCWVHANMAVQQFACKSSCSVSGNGKSLVVGWKGTPIYSFSAWKFRSRPAS
ncbi:PREDICTED: DELLA protein RGL1-like [Ipomoea nil]|uniref:DELLA protein RGL1-like n=1 Tax=Ipomoea nil TaxID=35883 RepID=UPI0009008BF2|nr:PREDICTED: DELLA protein RGL1-like [Ipomoea nil]